MSRSSRKPEPPGEGARSLSVLAAQIEAKKEEEHDHHEGEETDKKQEHNHEGGTEQDEHVWTSPKNAVKIVNKLAKQLGELDKDNKDYYADNARAYIKKLKKLDSQFENVVKRGKRKEIIVGDRFPFRYSH